MKIPVKKLKNGFEMPVYGFGTWQMGGRFNYDPQNDDEADIKAIKAALDLGVTHIDTAEVYANGYAEVLIGKAIKGYDRSTLFIVSKVAPEHLSHDDLIKSARDSLKRLEVDYLDLYLIHSCNPNISLKESMRALNFLVEEGLIRNIGISNFGIDLVEEAQSYSKYKVVANQVHYNLIYREPERKGLLEYCQKQNMMLIAWRPIQKGMIEEEGGSILKEVAEKYHKTPNQVAINWLILQDQVVTLSKTRDVAHLKENLGAIGWKLSKDDLEKLSSKFPNQQDFSDAVPLNKPILTR